ARAGTGYGGAARAQAALTGPGPLLHGGGPGQAHSGPPRAGRVGPATRPFGAPRPPPPRGPAPPRPRRAGPAAPPDPRPRPPRRPRPPAPVPAAPPCPVPASPSLRELGSRRLGGQNLSWTSTLLYDNILICLVKANNLIASVWCPSQWKGEKGRRLKAAAAPA